MNKIEKEVYFVSTPLHLLHAISAAMSSGLNKQSFLIIIDQPASRTNLYIQALGEWEESPFEKLHVFYSTSKNTSEKYGMRKRTLTEIRRIIEEIKPSVIYTGNDRRIEFLYGLSIMRKLNPDTKCIYMDDGIMTYVPHRYSYESYLEVLFKRFYYGFHYRRSRIVGGSPFIDEALVSFPDYVHSYLQDKIVKKSNGENLKSKNAKEFSTILLKKFSLDSKKVKSLDIVQILPHRFELKRFKSFFKKVKEMISRLSESGYTIGVKYHPQQEGDPLNLRDIDKVTILAADIAFEILLPILRDDAVIIGDVSTVLLTAKWLRPDQQIITIRNPEDYRHDKILPLMKRLGIIELSSPDEFNGYNIAETSNK